MFALLFTVRFAPTKTFWATSNDPTPEPLLIYTVEPRTSPGLPPREAVSWYNNESTNKNDSCPDVAAVKTGSLYDTPSNAASIMKSAIPCIVNVFVCLFIGFVLAAVPIK